MPFFRISDGTASPPLDVHLLAAIKQEFFNGAAPPRMGLFQENMSCYGPSTSGAFALFQEQANTYTMMQALQSWITLQPFGSPGATDPCLVTTVPGNRTTAISGPEVAIQRVYQTFGCRYFEIYQSDLLHPGFADEFQTWHDILSPVVCYADCNADGSLTVADFGCFQTRFVAGDPYADCNGAGGLTVADFGCFQTRFVAGCP